MIGRKALWKVPVRLYVQPPRSFASSGRDLHGALPTPRVVAGRLHGVTRVKTHSSVQARGILSTALTGGPVSHRFSEQSCEQVGQASGAL